MKRKLLVTLATFLMSSFTALAAGTDEADPKLLE